MPKARPALTREQIIDMAMEMAESGEALSFRKLGVALGVDPTAIYRRYPTKDDLVRAIVDRIAELAHAGVEPTDSWQGDFRAAAHRIRDFYAERPHLARLTAIRTSQGDSEFAIVEQLLEILSRSGLKGPRLARVYRASVVVWLTYALGESARAELDEETRLMDREAWSRDFRRLPDDEYPLLASVRGAIPLPDDPSTYDDILDLLISGIEVAASGTDSEG